MVNFMNPELIGIPLFEVDTQQTMIFAQNQRAQQLIQCKQGQLHEFLPKEEVDLLLHWTKRAESSQLMLYVSLELHWMEALNPLTYKASFIASDRQHIIVITLSDQTESVKALRQTQKSQNFLYSLLNLTNTLFFVVDRHLTITFANHAFWKMFFPKLYQNFNPSHPMSSSNPFSPIAHHSLDQISQLDNSFRKCILYLFDTQNQSSMVSQQIQSKWISELGQTSHFQFMIHPLISLEKKTEQLLILGSDFTDLIVAHEKQRKLQSALDQAHRLEAIGQMAGTIAHDFNGFLTVLISSIELINLEETNQEQTLLLDGMSRVCDQARQLTQDLLAFSRSQIEKQHPGSLYLLNQHLDFALPRLTTSNVKVSYFHQIQHNHLLYISEYQCSQIFVNLVNNAIEASDENQISRVNVESVSDEHGVRFTVEDYGSGIVKELQETIFEPFFTTKKNKGGTGLGLSSVHSLVIKAHGKITLESTRNVGTCFTVILPKMKDEAPL
jgi:signal transduction histidine kinase